MHKKLIMTMVLVLLLVGVSGCENTDGQAFEEFAIGIQTLSSRVDDYQEEMVKVVGMLEEDEMIDSTVVAKLTKINEEIDRVQPQVKEMAEAFKNLESGEFWDTIRTANAASAPWNPYAVPIGAALLLTEALTAMLLKKKSKAYTEESGKRKADKVGRERTLRELATMDEKDITAPVVKNLMYKNIGDERKANGVI